MAEICSSLFRETSAGETSEVADSLKPSSAFLKAIFWYRILFSILALSFHCLASFFLLFSLILYSSRVRESFQGEVDERDRNRKGRLSASSRQNCGILPLTALLRGVKDTKRSSYVSIITLLCIICGNKGESMCICNIPRTGPSSNPF